MNKEIAKRWVDALRSGKYAQGRGGLKPSPDTYCCLGVLCDIYRDENPRDGYWGRQVPSKFITVEESTEMVLPEVVQRWAGIRCEAGGLPDDIAGDSISLAFLNDGGRSFSYIAQIIETHWERI